MANTPAPSLVVAWVAGASKEGQRNKVLLFDGGGQRGTEMETSQPEMRRKAVVNDDMDVEDDHANEQNSTKVDEHDQEQGVATDELDLDSINFMVDGSHIGINEVGSELMGNLKAPEDPTREEASPSLYAKGECKAL
ncbi:hypothetical protein L1987_03205 [Smallanthus sonchifolius]|uniref:Uncharacterized protein n=1 Tax=Smallanthus sonchifolius TaxID=185202 RepID=A0ACB9KA38_9ASTR|nr:hypothetical protein L1987_03205 [Smallanthus sonchifolius]